MFSPLAVCLLVGLFESKINYKLGEKMFLSHFGANPDQRTDPGIPLLLSLRLRDERFTVFLRNNLWLLMKVIFRGLKYECV